MTSSNIELKEQMDELIAGFLSGGVSSEEMDLLLQWIESDSNNRKYYTQAYRTWVSCAQMRPLATKREEAALWKSRRRTFDVLTVSGKYRKGMSKTVSLRKVLKYAATVAVLLVVSTYGIVRHSMNRLALFESSESTYEAYYGSMAFTTLPDGSKVWLNSGSKLTVQAGYNISERRVHLSGEAYFQVTSNAKKPFIVQAGNLSVKATGTSFNVKAYPDEDRITATLVEGAIIIEGHDEHEKQFTYQLSPGQTVNYVTQKSVYKGTDQTSGTTTANVVGDASSVSVQKASALPISISKPDTEILTSWMRDRWIIDNEDLGSIAVKLERRYNVEIRFDSEKLKQYHFTGTIERETVEQIFDLFRYFIPLKYTIEKGEVRLMVDQTLEKEYKKAWKQN